MSCGFARIELVVNRWLLNLLKILSIFSHDLMDRIVSYSFVLLSVYPSIDSSVIVLKSFVRFKSFLWTWHSRVVLECSKKKWEHLWLWHWQFLYLPLDIWIRGSCIPGWTVKVRIITDFTKHCADIHTIQCQTDWGLQ